MPGHLRMLRSRHVLLGIALVSIISLLITLRMFNCTSCMKFESAYYQELTIDGRQQKERDKKLKGNMVIGTQIYYENRKNSNGNESLVQPQSSININSANTGRKEVNEDKAKSDSPRNFIEYNIYNNERLLARVQPQPEKHSSSTTPIFQVEPNLPIEKLCKGFKEEQAERIAALKARCEVRQRIFTQQNQEDPMRTRKGSTRIYVHRNRSLMWCETPKAMSTSWGRAIFALEGRDTGDVNYVWVHLFMQERFEFLSPSSLTMRVFRNVPHFDTYRKLLFLRDPFTRLHSAYIDKIVQPFLQYHNLVESINRELKCNYSSHEHKCLQGMENADHRKSECRRLINEHGPGVIIESPGLRSIITDLLGFDPDPKAFDEKTCNKIPVPDCSSAVLLKGCNVNLTAVPSFAEFVQYILEARDPKYAMDRHWSPVTLNCAPCSMPYTHILRLESMTRDVECMLREIYPLAAYSKLVSPTHYGIRNGNVIALSETSLNISKGQTNANMIVQSIQQQKSELILDEIGALRPRERDYRHDTARDRLKQHYSHLSPTLMLKLKEFYQDDTELFNYPSEPDFGLEKFR